MAVITLKNGDKIETKEDFDAVAAQCWIKDGYLNGCVCHDGDFEPFDEHYQAEKFVGSLESLVDSLVDTGSLTELPK